MVGNIVMAFALGLSIFPWFPALPAQASHCPERQDIAVRFNGNPPNHNSRGAGVFATTADHGIKVPGSNPPTCKRVGSVYIFRDDNNAIEIGYLWLADGHDNQCKNGAEGRRTRLVAAYDEGVVRCRPSAASSEVAPFITSGFHDFKIYGNLSGYYDLSVDGVLVTPPFPQFNFNVGTDFIGSERSHPSDSNYNEFDRTKWQDGSGFHNWNAWYCFLDTDDGYDVEVLATYHFKTSLSGDPSNC
jgi:hypothetical protein